MNRLTIQELKVLCVVVSLLLLGWAVKSYRTAHPLTATATIEGESAPAAQSGN